MTSKRRNTPTFSYFAVVAISSTVAAARELAITFGANCGSIITTSAPIARIFFRPSWIAVSPLFRFWSRTIELVPNCHKTRSGHGTVETLDHVVNFFAIYATIDHSDLAIGEVPLKLNGQTARISCAGCARACASGR